MKEVMDIGGKQNINIRMKVLEQKKESGIRGKKEG